MLSIKQPGWNYNRKAALLFLLFSLFSFTLGAGPARAGISAVNVLVAANRNSLESMKIAAYYIRARKIPRSHFVFLDIPEKFTINGTAYSSLSDIDYSNYVKLIEIPIKRKLSEPGLQGRIHAIVFTKGIPFRIRQKPQRPWRSGVTMSLIVGEDNKGRNPLFARDTGYNYSPELPEQPLPMLFYLAGWNYQDITAMIDRSVAADATFPKGTFYLLEGDGPRSSRKRQIPGIVRLAKQKGIPVKALPGSKLLNAQDILGYHTGCTRVRFQGNRMLPGAIGDNLTSFGGKLYEKDSGQTSILDYIRNGASMSYGTVFEPTANTAFHMDLSCVLYYGSGFTAGEAYAFNIKNLYWAVFVGDPMTAPFAHQPLLEEKAPGKYLLKASSPEANILRVELWQNGRFVRNVFEPRYKGGKAFFIGGSKGALVFSFQPGDTLRSFLQRTAGSLQQVLVDKYVVGASASYLTFTPVEKKLPCPPIGKLGLAKDGPLIYIKRPVNRSGNVELGYREWKFLERGNPTAEVNLQPEDLNHKDVYLNVICGNQAHTSKAFPLSPPAITGEGRFSSAPAAADSP